MLSTQRTGLPCWPPVDEGEYQPNQPLLCPFASTARTLCRFNGSSIFHEGIIHKVWSNLLEDWRLGHDYQFHTPRTAWQHHFHWVRNWISHSTPIPGTRASHFLILIVSVVPCWRCSLGHQGPFQWSLECMSSTHRMIWSYLAHQLRDRWGYHYQREWQGEEILHPKSCSLIFTTPYSSRCLSIFWNPTHQINESGPWWVSLTPL